MDALIDTFRSARANHTLAILEGFHAVKHAIRFGAEIDVIVTRDPAGLAALGERLAPDVASQIDQRVVPVPLGVFDRLSPTPHDTGVVAIAKRRITTVTEIASTSGPAPVVLLDQPSHSGNIGAAIRAAAGAGAAAVVTLGGNDPWHPAALRGSAGLHYALPVTRTESAAVPGYRLIAIDPDGDPLVAGAIPHRALLAFGSERRGLSAAILADATARVRIPMEPGVSSLNLATAVAVVLYTWRLSR